jgi:hypothetical protein
LTGITLEDPAMRRHPAFAAVTRFAALATLLLLPASLWAQDLRMMGPVVWRMRGTVVADEKTANDMGWTGISLGFTGKDDSTMRWFGAVHAEIFGGDTFDAWSYINNVSHYNPTIIIAGPPNLSSKLFAMPNGTRVALEGVLDPLARNLMLDVVKQLPGGGGGS